MLKKITLVMFSVFMLAASSAMANDDLLNELASGKGQNIADASVEVEDFNLDIDVDELAANADGEEADAVEACFRRFGYRSYGGYGYGYGYRCFRPVYNCYSYYRPMLCQPIYHSYHTYCAPVVSHYWGCY